MDSARFPSPSRGAARIFVHAMRHPIRRFVLVMRAKTPISHALVLAVAFALALPSIAAAQICGSPGSCLTPRPTPGCDGVACCTLVCQIDPSCCGIGGWDQSCVILANSSCVGYPGAAASGSCFTPHANPNCDSATCSSAVCVFDPFCCTTSWDASCAALAGFACPGNPGTCGGPGTGGCFEPQPNGACNDATCCTAVCAVDPTCCSEAWDQICVILANTVCVTNCEPFADPDSVAETELCDARANDPCYAAAGGAAEVLLPNRQLRGRLGAIQGNKFPADVDVFDIMVEDGDGDGFARVTLDFSSSSKAWAALLAGSKCTPIADALLTVASELCVDTASASLCVPAGAYRVVVAGGVFPAFGDGIVCGTSDRYTIKVAVDEGCSEPCTGSGNGCFAPAKSAGCDDETCCVSVCSIDPFCCNSAWDTSCVALAADRCLSGPPANDACAAALPLIGGATLVNTLRSTLELPASEPTCGAATFARDVWLRWTSDRNGFVEITTCSTWFDTVLAVYRGSCGALQAVGCNDNAPLCGSGGSRVGFKASCGESYLIRVGPRSGGGGETLVFVESVAPTCAACTGDLNGDGAVDAQDLASILSGWGSPSGDLNGDGTTDAQDLAALLGAWGPCP